MQRHLPTHASPTDAPFTNDESFTKPKPTAAMCRLARVGTEPHTHRMPGLGLYKGQHSMYSMPVPGQGTWAYIQSSRYQRPLLCIPDNIL